MKRSLGIVAFVALISTLPLGAIAAGKPQPSPSPSGSPAPLPTATPEPPDIAIPRLEAKVKADPNDKASQIELAQYYLTVGRPDKSLPITQNLLKNGTKNAQVYFLDGSGLASIGRLPQATTDMEQASNLEPTNLAVLLRLTDLYLRQNRAADAERVAKRALTFNKDDEQAMITYGLVLAQENKFEDARTQFEAAAKANPKDPTPVIREGQSYVDQKAYDYAIQTFDRALAIDPKNVEALQYKAEVLSNNMNRVKDAIAVYDQLLGLVTTDDERVSVLNREAVTYTRAKQSQEAQAVVDKMVSTYPKNVGAQIYAGNYYAASNQLSKAEASWKAALAIDPKAPDALAQLSRYYMSSNNAGQAIEYLKRLAEVDASNPEVLFALGQAYGVNKQYDRSKDACGRSFEIQRTPQALTCIAEADYQTRNYKEGSKIFDALDKNAGQYLNQNPQLIFLAGQTYDKNGQKPQAKVMYKRFLAYVKPGSQAASEVKRLIDDIDKGSGKAAAAPKATPAPKKK